MKTIDRVPTLADIQTAIIARFLEGEYGEGYYLTLCERFKISDQIANATISERRLKRNDF